jgi:hypothetical protein
MRRPIHRIRAARGCEHLRYARGPSNKESRSLASRGQGPLAASDETPDKPEGSCSSSHPIGSDERSTEPRSSPPVEKRQHRAHERSGIVDIGPVRGFGNDGAPHVPDRRLESIEDAVE